MKINKLQSNIKNNQISFGARKFYLSAYLAGPDVFLPNALEIAQIKKGMLKKIGIKGHFPLDNVLNLKILTKQQASLLISRANEDLMRKSDMGLFNLTPFRSPSADAGTIYEEGFMSGLNKILYGYSNTTKTFHTRTKEFLGMKGSKTVEDILVDGHKMSLENFDLEDNLMISGGIVNQGGKFITANVPEAEIHSSLAAFSKLIDVLNEDLPSILTKNKINKGAQ
jgi:nucleoside 2-deoxyribosyltransferase